MHQHLRLFQLECLILGLLVSLPQYQLLLLVRYLSLLLLQPQVHRSLRQACLGLTLDQVTLKLSLYLRTVMNLPKTILSAAIFLSHIIRVPRLLEALPQAILLNSPIILLVL